MNFNSYLINEREYPLESLRKKVDALRKEGRTIIDLTIGDPKDPTYTDVVTRTIKALERTPVSQYPKTLGNMALLDAFSAWARTHHAIELTPVKHTISCNGTKEAIFHLAMAFDWSDRKEIWFSSLSYPVYKSSAGLLGIPYRELPVSEATNFFPDLERISEEDWKKCRLFWLNSPHNPTSAIASKAYMSALIKRAEKYDFLIASDECYNDLYYGDEEPTSVLDFPESTHWISCRSLSKRSHMTGYRSGILASKNEPLMAMLAKSRAPMGVGTPSFIQEGATAAWLDETHVLTNRANYKAKRDSIKKALEEKGFRVFGAEAGFYMWLSHPKYSSSEALCELFLDQDMLMTPGTAFGKDGEGYARLTYCIVDVAPVVQKINQLAV